MNFKEFLNEAKIFKYIDKSVDTSFGMNAKSSFVKLNDESYILDDFEAFKKAVLAKTAFKEKNFGAKADSNSIYIKLGKESIVIDGKDFKEFLKSL